jgi:hypothetical protein
MATTDLDRKTQQAIKDLHITVPIYQVHALQTGGLRLWLYGHTEPVDWTPKPKRTRRKPTKANA